MENVTERCIVRFQFELCIGSAYMQEDRSPPARARAQCFKKGNILQQGKGKVINWEQILT